MICADASCGCAIVSDSLTISGSGGSGDPYRLETNAFTVCTSVTRPATPFVGQFIYETNTGLSYAYSGSAWRLFGWTTTPACTLYTAAADSIAHNVTEEVNFDTERYDPFGWHSGVNPNRVTPTIPGWYSMTMSVHMETGIAYSRVMVGPRKNGALWTPFERSDSDVVGGAGWAPAVTVSTGYVTMNGTTDYLSAAVYHNNASSLARTVTATLTVEWKANL